MQNLSKWYNRHLFLIRRLSNVVLKSDEVRTSTNLNDEILRIWNTPSIRKCSQPLSHNVFSRIFQECRVLCSLLSQNQYNHRKNINEIKRRLSNLSQRGRENFSSNKNSSDGSSQSDDKQPPDDKHPRDELATLAKIAVILVIFYLLFSYSLREGGKDSLFISWSEFLHQMLAKGEVKEIIVRPDMDWVSVVLHEGAIVNGMHVPYRHYDMIVADASQLEEKIREAEAVLGIRPGEGVPINYERPNPTLMMLLVSLATFYIFMAFGRSQQSKISSISNSMLGGLTKAKFTLVKPYTGGKGVKFSDVAGLKEAKIEVMEFVDYLKQPDRYKTLGAKVPRGALLLGPPGCGKTMLAKAVATEASVPFLSMNGSEFIEMIGGLGAARVRDLFSEARKRSPSILYIDEIDAIGKKRLSNEPSSHESENTLNQLLVEMDGMASKEGIIILASTNRPDVLDKALLRPGRFDRHILIDLPTLAERKEIFEQHLRSIVLEKEPRNYSEGLAQLTPGFSGADIANLCNEAALHAARVKKKFVDGDDLSYAVDRVMCGAEKKDHAISPVEKEIVAYHEAGHALVSWLLKHTDALIKVTIKPTTRGHLGFSQFTSSDRKNHSKEQLFENMCALLGGRAAENIIFNRITTGAQNDLEKVTRIAYMQIRQLGMNKNVGLLSFTDEETSTSQKKPYSKKLANLMDLEVRKLIAQAYQTTEKLLRDNHDKLEMIAKNLLKQETLMYDEVEKLIGPPPFGQKKKIEHIDDIGLPIEKEPDTQEPQAVPPSDNVTKPA